MTAHDIIVLARERLGDLDKQRWTDSRLLTIVSQAQADICKETGFLRKEAVIPLAEGIVRYALPTDCYQIRRVEYRDRIIELHSRNDHDNRPRLIKNQFVALKSNVNLSFIDIYPKAPEIGTPIVVIKGQESSDDFVVTPSYGVSSVIAGGYAIAPKEGVVTGMDINLIGSELSDGYGEVVGSSTDSLDIEPEAYGVVVKAEFTKYIVEKLGFITHIETTEPNTKFDVSGQYGISTTLVNADDMIRVFYVAVPRTLISDSDELVLPYMWESLFVRYTVGTALQDDNDANNIQRGELELSKYLAEVKQLSDLSSADYSGNADTKYETDFRSI